ncbi:MAG: MMPL family transporter [Homoserinimonas sp.]
MTTPDGPAQSLSPERPRVPRWLRVLLPVVLALGWLAVAGVGGSSFGEVNDVASNDGSQQLPASAEATAVNELQGGFRDDGVLPAVIVYERGGGLTDADERLIRQQADRLSTIAGVEADSVSPPVFSDDGEAAEIFVSLNIETDVDTTVGALRGHISKSSDAGLTALVTGPAGFTADIVDAFRGIDGILLVVALAAVLIILVVVYRSPLLPLIVLGTSMFALTAAMFVVVELAKSEVIVLSGQTQGILMILVIGAATDYSLLYVARYKEALRDHQGRWDATWAALKGAFEPILASGGTVIVGLLILLFSDLGSNRAMGPVAAIGVGFAVLAALTFLPSILLAAGRVAFWPFAPTLGSEHPAHRTSTPGVWGRVGRLVARRPRTVWIANTLVLAVASLGMLQLQADGVAQSEVVLGESQARDGQAVLGEHFPGGSGTPAVIIAPESELGAVANTILGTEGVASLSVLSDDSPSGTAPVTVDGIRALGPPGTPAPEAKTVDGRVMLQATLDDAGDSADAATTVTALRASFQDGGSEAIVGGVTAVAIDTNEAAIHDRNLIIPLVLAAILLILMLLLRSVLAPVLLIASVVLSFGAALGVSALVFNGIFDFPGADPSVPMFGFVFLVALGIDYNIFLMTRVREESKEHGTREGVLRGLSSTGGVITSAGLVLAATFAALGVLPILFLAQISFIVAFGVLLDTFLVRSLLVPALSYDIGRKVWWPSALARGPVR